MSTTADRSLKLGTFAGIPVKVHWSFGFILFFIAYLGVQDNLTISGYAWLAATVISLFTCVVLHEYGHALTARKYGIKTNDILLTPIGGIARLQGMPQKPMQEFYIAIAGPLVNVGLMLLALIYMFFTIKESSTELLEDILIIDSFSELVIYLFFLNFMLFAFNLIPAFPMDGGRILRSLLSLKMPKAKATKIASVIGRVIAVIFIILAVYLRHFSLGFIGVFVFIMAQREYKMVQMDERMQLSNVSDILRQQYSVLYEFDPISKALKLKNNSDERSFIVLNQMNQVVGVVHEFFLQNLNKDFNPDDSIRKILSPRFEYIAPAMSLNRLFRLMQSKGYSILPVWENGMMIGVVDRRDLSKFIKG